MIIRKPKFISRRSLLIAAPALILARAAWAQVGQIVWPPITNPAAAGGGGGGGPLIANTAAGSTTGNGVTTSAINTTGANLIVIGVAYTAATNPPAVSDSQSNTWTALSEFKNSFGEGSRLWYCYLPTTSASHSFTESGASTFTSIFVQAFNGATTGPFDKEDGNNSGSSGATSAAPSAPILPAQNNEIIVSHLTINGSLTGVAVDSGFTITDSVAMVGGQHFSGAMAYLKQGTAASVQPTWSWSTTSTDDACAIASFRAT